MSCPLCGKPEKRERCCWPMKTSPREWGVLEFLQGEPDPYMEEMLRMAVMGVE